MTASFYIPTSNVGASEVAQWIQNLPAIQETQEMQVRPLGQEDPLEEGMATHSSSPSWIIPCAEKPGMGLQRVYD